MSINQHNNKCYYHGPMCRSTVVLYGAFCTFYCNFVTSNMIMIINMKCVFWTGTLGAVNMRVSGRCVVWRFQQWSSVTIIHSKPSRYIHSSPKYSLNVLFKVILFTYYRFSPPWLKSIWVCWSRIGYFFFVYCVNNSIFSFSFYYVTCLSVYLFSHLLSKSYTSHWPMSNNAAGWLSDYGWCSLMVKHLDWQLHMVWSLNYHLCRLPSCLLEIWSDFGNQSGSNLKNHFFKRKKNP